MRPVKMHKKQFSDQLQNTFLLEKNDFLFESKLSAVTF
jgi:hypothetical protein